MARTRLSLLAAAAAALLTLSACSGDDTFEEPAATSGGQTAGGGSGEPIVVGGANFTEMAVMQEMYVALLEDAGYETETLTAGNRELYFPALASGEIDVVPEYAATLAEFLNRAANGPDAEPLATNDAAETVEAMRPLAQEQGVRILEPAQAASQNGFAVTQELAEANDLQTLSDLGELEQPVVLAGPEECPERPFCEPGLEQTYGIDVTEVLPTGFGTPQTKQAVQSGEAQVAVVGTTDATLDQFGLVLLEDDQELQLADNLVPAVNAEAADEQLVETLDSLADVLTTQDLAELNRQVDAERLQPADVARAWLEEQGLLSD